MHCVPPSPSLGVVHLSRELGLLTEESEVEASWAGCFEWLFQADPSAVDLDVSGVTIPIADPPINCDPRLFVETQAAANRLKWDEVPGICGIHVELLKAGGNAAFLSLHAVLCSAWNTGIIPTDWKRGLVVPLWKGNADHQDCNNYQLVTLLSVPCKVFARIITHARRKSGRGVGLLAASVCVCVWAVCVWAVCVCVCVCLSAV